MAHAGAQAKQRAEGVDFQDVMHHRRVGFVEPRKRADDAGAVHESVDAAEFARGRVEHTLDIGFHAHVALQRGRFAAGRLHRVHHSGCGLGVALVVDRDVVAARAGKFCGGCADPAATAGNEQDRSWHCKLLSGRPRQQPGQEEIDRDERQQPGDVGAGLQIKRHCDQRQHRPDQQQDDVERCVDA